MTQADNAVAPANKPNPEHADSAGADHVACDCCDWHGHRDEANEVRDWDERMDLNGEKPDGECPECGALCYSTTVVVGKQLHLITAEMMAESSNQPDLDLALQPLMAAAGIVCGGIASVVFSGPMGDEWPTATPARRLEMLQYWKDCE